MRRDMKYQGLCAEAAWNSRHPLLGDPRQELGTESAFQNNALDGTRLIQSGMARKRQIPRCLIIAGPNGAGKTTFARDYLSEIAGLIHFINADLIAGGMSPLQPQLAAVAAANLFYENWIDWWRRKRILRSRAR